MERFLSPGWFAMVAAAADPSTEPADLVLQQVVSGTPYGEVRYQVSVRDGRATIRPGSATEADMTFSSDYETAGAIAAGTTSTESALTRGRIRISGNLSRLDVQGQSLVGIESLPGLRSNTSFDTDAEMTDADDA